MKDKKEIILSDFQALTIDAKVSNPGPESRAVVRESESRLEYDMFASFFFLSQTWLRLVSDWATGFAKKRIDSTKSKCVLITVN